MPSLKRALVQGQMIIDVCLFRRNLDGTCQTDRQTTLPGLIDTGANVSGVTEQAAVDSDLIPWGTRDMGGVQGVRKDTPAFWAFLAVPFENPSQRGAPILPIQTEIWPTEILTGPTDPFEVVIGTDVLKDYCLLVVNGEYFLSTPY